MFIGRVLWNEQYEHVGYRLAVRCIERDRYAQSCEDGNRSLQAFDTRVGNGDTSPQSRGPERFPLDQTDANLFRIQTMACSQKIRDGLERLVLAVRIEVQNDVLGRQQIRDRIARARRYLARIASIGGMQELFHDHFNAAERCSGETVASNGCCALAELAFTLPVLLNQLRDGSLPHSWQFLQIGSWPKARAIGRNLVSGFSARV